MRGKDLLRKAELLGLAGILAITGSKVGENIINEEHSVGITETISAKIKQPKAIVKYFKNTKIKQSQSKTTLWDNGKKKKVVVTKYNKANQVVSTLTKTYNNKGVILKSVEYNYAYNGNHKETTISTIKYVKGKQTSIIKEENYYGDEYNGIPSGYMVTTTQLKKSAIQAGCSEVMNLYSNKSKKNLIGSYNFVYTSSSEKIIKSIKSTYGIGQTISLYTYNGKNKLIKAEIYQNLTNWKPAKNSELLIATYDPIYNKMIFQDFYYSSPTKKIESLYRIDYNSRELWATNLFPGKKHYDDDDYGTSTYTLSHQGDNPWNLETRLFDNDGFSSYLLADSIMIYEYDPSTKEVIGNYPLVTKQIEKGNDIIFIGKKDSGDGSNRDFMILVFNKERGVMKSYKKSLPSNISLSDPIFNNYSGWTQVNIGM